LQWSFTDTPVIGSLTESASISSSRTIANGTGEGQANVAWRDRVTISSGQTYSVSLDNLGATAFGYGGRVVITVLKEMRVNVRTTAAGRYVLVGVIGPSDATAYSARVNRGGDYAVADYLDGWAVNAGNKTVYIANPSGGAVEIDLAFVGVGTTQDT
jgi:hypothetical protein